MRVSGFSESVVKDAALVWLERLGYSLPSLAFPELLNIAEGRSVF